MKAMFPVLLLMAALGSPIDLLADQAKEDPVIYQGHFAIQEGPDKVAELSGFNQYVKFYPGNRFVRLYVPYQYSLKVDPAAIGQALDQAFKEAGTGDAFIRSDFGVLKERAIAHVDHFERAGDQILFDCGVSAPCRIEFEDDRMRIVKKGIVKDHVFEYLHRQ